MSGRQAGRERVYGRTGNTMVHVVLPNDIDDPAAPSGGNVYDRRVCRGLAAAGWSVSEHAVCGAWPHPGRAERAMLAGVLAGLPDDGVVLIDGLIASVVPEVLAPQALRLRLVVLLHMPLGDGGVDSRRREREALGATAAIVTTSRWSRDRLLDLYDLPADRIHVAPPGVDPAPLAHGSDAGSRLLCVAAVTPDKGYDVLVDALAAVSDATWSCVCVGSSDRDPTFAERVRKQVDAYGLTGRVSLVGPRTGADLEASYAAADLLVLASRGETYGMVVTEALAHAIPVLATAANGLAEALGRAPDGSLPGILVRPDDPGALADALRLWLGEPDVRQQLRVSAGIRRTTLTGWAITSELVAKVLWRAATKAGAHR
jgi:glycosyltransferase involved in cell wall biosynthesis